MVLALPWEKGSSLRRSCVLNQAAKHHWYGDRSPWTEQRSEDPYGFKGPQRPLTAPKTVILDRENPPQLRSRHIDQD